MFIKTYLQHKIYIIIYVIYTTHALFTSNQKPSVPRSEGGDSRRAVSQQCEPRVAGTADSSDIMMLAPREVFARLSAAQTMIAAIYL
jgi:hypothetical protein